MPLKVNALDIELGCGGVTVSVNIVDNADRRIIDNVHAKLQRAIADRSEGVEFYGETKFKYHESMAAINFDASWDRASAEMLANVMNTLQHALSEGAGRGSSLTNLSVHDAVMNTCENDIPSESSAPNIPPIDLDRSGWIHALQDQNSQLWKLLARHQIESDESYIRKEKELPIESRLALAKYRFQYGAQKSENHEAPGGRDIRVIALFAPPWITKIPVTVSGFPVRAANVLHRERISTMQQLRVMSHQALLRLSSFGRRTYEDMFDSLHTHLLSQAEAALRPPQNSEVSNGVSKPVSFASFQALWEGLMSFIDDERKQEILSRRVGLSNAGCPDTLDTIGKDYDVTRERIRQLQADAIKQLHADLRFRRIKEALEREMRLQIEWRQGPIPLGDDCSVTALRDAPVSVLKLFFNMILKSRYKVLSNILENGKESGRIVSGVSEEEHKSAIEQVEAFIRANSNRRKSELLRLLDSYIKETFDPSIYSDLKSYVDEWINWDYSDDPGIISFGDSVHAAVAAVLVRADRPLKREEIVDRAREEFGLRQSSASILNYANELCESGETSVREDVLVPLFQPAHGEYCAKKHLNIDLDNLDYLIPDLVSLIVDGRESLITGHAYQWHAADLWREVTQRFPNNPLSALERGAGWRAVDALLRYHLPRGVTSLTKGFWIAQEPESTVNRKRTKQEVIEYILKNHAGPNGLSRRELFDLFKQVQSPGVVDPFQGLKSPVALKDGRYRLVK